MQTILLVDDSRVAREVIKVYFVAKDIALLEAADGLEALARVRERRPDIVVADLRMPRLDGPGFCRALQADPATRNLPVLILTGNRDPDSTKLCLDAGAREVLAKPIQPQALLAAVRRHIAVNS